MMNKPLIILLTLALFYMGCSQKETEVVTKITIAGKVENTAMESIEVFLEEEIASTKYDEDGTFHISFDAEEAATYFLRAGVGNFRLFLSPGDSVYVTADGENFKTTLHLEGTHAAESTYLNQQNDFYTEELGDMFELMGLPKDEYMEKKYYHFTQQRQRLEALKSAEKLNSIFLLDQEAYLDYHPLYLDLQYPLYHAYAKGISKDSVDFPVEETKATLAKVNLERADLMHSRMYRFVIERLVNDRASEMRKQDSSLINDARGFEKATFMAAEELLKNQAVKDHFMFNYIKSNMDYMGPVYVKDAYDQFLAENNSPKLVDKLQKAKEKWDPILPGKEIPDFSFINVEGDSVKLSDLRGNLVYIDIWATWCGPCIAEHPHWDELRASYKDKDVAFLALSIDDSKEPWEKMVKSKKMEGLQWFAENAWKSEIARHFMVNAIPRFLLLDKEGKIIDPSADRPSGKINEVLDRYL
jgi:thiol-disulfide isomerase/thioredoxin